MNEPNIGVALVYLGAIAAGLLLPAPLIAFSARRGSGLLWLTCAGIALVLILIVVRVFGDRSSMNAGDEKLFYNIVGLIVISIGAAGWAANRKRRLNPATSYFSLLRAAVSMQIASLIIFALMPGSC